MNSVSESAATSIGDMVEGLVKKMLDDMLGQFGS